MSAEDEWVVQSYAPFIWNEFKFIFAETIIINVMVQQMFSKGTVSARVVETGYVNWMVLVFAHELFW